MNALMQSRIDVKDAVRAAKAFVADILAAENVTNIGLEEVRLDEDQWLVTIGFSRSWDSPKPTGSVLDTLQMFPRSEGKREYKVVKVDAATGKVRGMELREENG